MARATRNEERDGARDCVRQKASFEQGEASEQTPTAFEHGSTLRTQRWGSGFASYASPTFGDTLSVTADDARNQVVRHDKQRN